MIYDYYSMDVIYANRKHIDFLQKNMIILYGIVFILSLINIYILTQI